MKILPAEMIKPQMILGQNIIRHDGLLSLPKGIILGTAEIELLKEQQLNFIIVLDIPVKIYRSNDINFTLSIIEAAYRSNTLWDPSFGSKIFSYIEKRVAKNKKIQQYLNELRELDSYSFVHCINVSMLVTLLLKDTDISFDDLGNIALLTLLHDVGRIKIPYIFNKKGHLTKSEFEQLKTHPIISFKMLKKAGFSDSELTFILEHHEKYDGSGYPYRISGEEISDLSQIVLLADFYNGLLSYRPHRKAFSPYEVIEMMIDEKNKAFGEEYVRFFLDRFTPYRIGCSVELSNGETATVSGLHKHQKTLPIVDIYEDGMRRAVTIDLFHNRSLTIKRVIQEY